MNASPCASLAPSVTPFDRAPPARSGFPDTAPEGLLSTFQPGDALFSSPRHHLHARGVAGTIEGATQDLDEAVASWRRGAATTKHPVPLLGAIPFDVGRGARLWWPQQAVFATGSAGAFRASPLEPKGDAAVPCPPDPSPHAPIRAWPEPPEEAARYRHTVARVLEHIRSGELSKAVLSRCIDVPGRIDVRRLLARLLDTDYPGYVYAVPLQARSGTRCLVGTSPELLLSKRGLRIVSNPLAGSVPRSQDAGLDRQRARDLLSSPKDRHEHRLVVEAVAAALRPWCDQLQVPTQPEVISTPTLWHLSTRIEGRLRDPEASGLAIALSLHPTPAVCGHPRHAALALIRRLEGYDRELFTGLVGWCDEHGDGEWAVTLRCAVLDEGSARLYAGAGIVEGSQPDLEYEETRAKLRTLLDAFADAARADDEDAAG